MSEAIGQSRDRLVPAEAEVVASRIADRPAAFPLAEFKQRAAAPVVDRHDRLIASARLGCSECIVEQFALSKNIGAHAQGAPRPWALRTGQSCGAPQGLFEHVSRPRKSQAAQFADNGIPGHSDFTRDLAACEPGFEAAFELIDAFRISGCTGRKHGDGPQL